MKGKAIYQPKGAAAEYAKYACNFFKGCSNSCSYCFNKRWKWGDTPKLKSCFKDESHALEVFEKELKANLPELRKYGLFFSFTTDPMLPETNQLTLDAIEIAAKYGVKSKILTKRADFITYGMMYPHPDWTHVIAFGFTLTGHDELEPHASTNTERIEAMRKLHEAGFKTFASIEPVIDIKSSMSMIYRTAHFCDLYKIGLESGKKYKNKPINEINYFLRNIISYFKNDKLETKVYFKDSLLQQAGIKREELPNNCVGRDYNMFNT